MGDDAEPGRGGRDFGVLASAAQRLWERFPLADPAMIVRAVIDARDGLVAFGFRGDERSATLLLETAAIDPRLLTPRPAATGS